MIVWLTDAAGGRAQVPRGAGRCLSEMDNVAVRLLALFASACIRRLYRAERTIVTRFNA